MVSQNLYSTSDLTLATEEVRDLWQVRVGAKALILPRYNKQHKQDQGTLALLVRVVAKINVRIEQNPGYGMLNIFMPSYANWKCGLP